MRAALHTWTAIALVVLTTTAGDVLLARAMQRIGDTFDLHEEHGVFKSAKIVLTNVQFLVAVFFMALSFFSLLVALSWGDVSLVAPASASLTFVTNAFAARLFLGENVDRRRWISALFVGAGVALLAQ